MVTDLGMRRPNARLAPYVERYVGYRLAGFPAGVHRGLPSRHLTFIVSLDQPVEILATPDPSQPPIVMQAFVGGLHTRAALIRHDGNQHGIAVELTPLGARAVLGIPGGEFAGGVVDLVTLLGARGRELTERLLNTTGWASRFAALDEILTSGLCERYLAPVEVVQAWGRLVGRGGRLDVEALAGEVGWSRQHFTERFHREVGLPPRQLARVLRFERSCRLLGWPDQGTLTDVAADAGYFDQAHMLHELRRLAGCTPSEWQREELPPVQDSLESVNPY
jgi:AraC-like DNA-binding protein